MKYVIAPTVEEAKHLVQNVVMFENKPDADFMYERVKEVSEGVKMFVVSDSGEVKEL